MAETKHLPKHLLVLRTSAMGDVAMLPHALRALQTAYPALKITVATQPMFRPFFRGLTVDFLDVKVKAEHHSVRGMWRLAREARALGVDAVADVHAVLRSLAFSLSMRLHGIRTARIRKGRSEKRQAMGSGGDFKPLKHSVVRYCDVFRRLGFVFDDPTPATKPMWGNPLGEKQGCWVGFAPFSAHAGKTYPEEQSRQLMQLLAARYDRVLVHGGGGREQAFAEEMEAAYPNVTALFGKVRFAGEMEVIAQEDCLVSMDSMAMHLASLVATPVVSVWGATHPALGFLGWGCRAEDALQTELPCRPCSVFGAKPCKYGDYHCLKAISAEQVAAQVERVITRSKGEQNE